MKKKYWSVLCVCAYVSNLFFFFFLSLSVILLDNLKGRQLLHTTYKMFMTAAGVEGENRRSVTHAAVLLTHLSFMTFLYLSVYYIWLLLYLDINITLALISEPKVNLGYQIILSVFHQIYFPIFIPFDFHSAIVPPSLISHCLLHFHLLLCYFYYSFYCPPIFFLPSSQFALLLYLLEPLCQRWSGKWVSKDTWWVHI